MQRVHYKHFPILHSIFNSINYHTGQLAIFQGAKNYQKVDYMVDFQSNKREAISAGNSTEATARLTSIIGELSDAIARITSDQKGQRMAK